GCMVILSCMIILNCLYGHSQLFVCSFSIGCMVILSCMIILNWLYGHSQLYDHSQLAVWSFSVV
ncbi:hypothetical protein LOTGIDRAFT_147570, partial [Lottia gigantea]